MPTVRETILDALHARLLTLPATSLRSEVLPERVPPDGLLILRESEQRESCGGDGHAPWSAQQRYYAAS